MRHAATRALLERDDVIIVASVSCIYGIGSVETYTAMTFSVKVGEKIDQRQLIADLVALHYKRSMGDFSRGVFRVRGDTVDIFPSYATQGVRVEFFGDEVESLAVLDPATGKVAGTMVKTIVSPAKHFVMPHEKIEPAIARILAELSERVAWFEQIGRAHV